MDNLALYQELLNLPSVSVSSVKVEKDKIYISCEVLGETCKCPKCGATCSSVHQRYERTLRDLNMASREVYLLLKVRQFYGSSCHHYFTESLDFAASGKSYTHRQADFMFLICRKQSYQEAAAILNMHSKTLERSVLSTCQKRADLASRYAQVRRLGIDEQSHRKGKKDYLCILTDLDRGRIVDILESRKKEDLIAHFQSLGKDFCEQITDVSCDYWQAYISVAETCFPNATIVLDRFHVVKLLNDCLDTFRKSLRKKYPDNLHYRRLKWILYKQYHRLSDSELDDLEAAFEDCPTLKEIYWTREAFHHLLDNHTEVEQVLEKIEVWEKERKEDIKKVFEPFCKTLKNTKKYIANYVKNNLSNAVTEGLNNLIRSIRRAAFGMPNFEHLRWRALAISE
ncbi:MAG: ISL3 family transposase [Okeania sp. SIO3C4]|nr:ISL3 family transposase [Okeania sp. SIO3C4]